MAGATRSRTATQVRERIISNVVIDDNGCWVWRCSLTKAGYGRMTWLHEGSRIIGSHRIAHTVFSGPIPDGLWIDHLCSNRACCNPKHLELVTPRENALRSDRTLAFLNGTKTHCKNGHPYTPENTYGYGPNRRWRTCRTCAIERAKATYRRKVLVTK